ncbi:MAG: elongation factor P [Verrucomicrobiota bacterium]|nr:MAG: elongation factor P [Verrucomicrobiota bacterium]
MASPTDIRKGKVIMYQGVPHLVLEMMHRMQGRQAGFVQTTLRNLATGASTTVKFRSTENVEFCHVATETYEYSYEDPQGVHFMSPETFEDTVLPASLIEDQKKYLVPAHEYDLLFVDGKAMEVRLPSSVDMKVVDAPEGVRGDTASNVQKPATTESGLTLQVPLFIKEGDIIRVSTDTGKYLGRA